ncbi:UNVERIFIED_CONTAM: Retrovirus-related Pol polyprotein from transposon gypsy [Sesamum radiatum]|uniref:Retrovirus-related Pol polyprotein from transposon gypsy n=1 Tax=Sesamum radiatum TaxID=300843 RepID=A0AAW2NSE1_SESRA
MCTDFTYLNKACPNDPYPLPRIDLLVDSTAECALFSMMDAYQGYHQIFMAEEDRDKTSFVTEKGVYCYNVMPFGLKNAGATYQKLVNRMFKEVIGSTMEIYVDDMLVKSRMEEEHLRHLESTFAIMRTYGMKLNSTKCTFGVRGGKILGYIVSEHGIKANPEKIKAIMQLSMPKTIKDVQKLIGNVASLNRFIARKAQRVSHDTTTIGKPGSWGETYIYLVVSENAISLLLVREEHKEQRPAYYVSRMLERVEKRYIQIEKLGLALVTTARKLRPYFQSHPIVVLTNHPLKQVMAKPDVSGQLVKWAVELGEFDIEFQTRTTTKAQVFADFMVEFAGGRVRREKKDGCCMLMAHRTQPMGKKEYFYKG